MTDNPFGGLSISIIDSAADAGAEAIARPGGPSSDTGGDGIVETKMVIVGSGPAGLTAAIYAARANLEPVVLAGSAPGGQLMLTSDVENFPGFPDGIQGPELMAAFRAQAERFGTRIVDVDIDRVDLGSRPYRHLGARDRVPGTVRDRRHGRIGAVARPRLRDAAPRPRGLRVRDL